MANKIYKNERREKYIPLSEAAKVYGCTQKHLNLMARQGKLKAVKINRNWMTTFRWLEDYTRHLGKVAIKLSFDKYRVFPIFKKAFAFFLLTIILISFIGTIYVSAKDGTLPISDSFKKDINTILSAYSSTFTLIKETTKESFNSLVLNYTDFAGNIFVKNQKVNIAQSRAVLETNKVFALIFNVPSVKISIDKNIGNKISYIAKTIAKGFVKADRSCNKFFAGLLDEYGNFVINATYKTYNSIIKFPSSVAHFANNAFSSIGGVFASLPHTFSKIFSFKFVFPFYSSTISEDSFNSIKDLYHRLSDLRSYIEGKKILVREEIRQITQQITITQPIKKEVAVIKDKDLLNAELATWKSSILTIMTNDLSALEGKIGNEMTVQNNYYFSEATKVGRIDEFNNEIDFNENTDFNKSIYVLGDITVANNLTLGSYLDFGGIATPSSSAGRVYYEEGSNQLLLYDGLGWQNLASAGGSDLWTQIGSDIYYATGMVGIGDMIPAYTLSVDGTASISGGLYVDTFASISGDFSVASSGYVSGDDYGPTLYVDTGNNYVGIGITNPSAKLHVKDTNSLATLGSENQLTADGTFSTSDGWTVGSNWSISGGKATHSSGSTATLSGTTTVSSGTMYSVEMNFSSVTGGSVTIALGSVSSSFSTAGNPNGVWLIPTADNAALTITPSSDFVGSIDNIYIYALTPGSRGEIVIDNGTGAGYETYLKTGDQGSYATSVLIGAEVGRYLYTGSTNYAIGEEALRYITDGYENVAIGAWALRQLRGGGENIAIGDLTLGSMQYGWGNVAIGYSALWSHTGSATSGYNTAIGDYALANLTSGTGMIAIGAHAGLTWAGTNDPVTDTNGILIGYESGRSVATAGLTNYIGIGYGTTIDKSNQVVIGNPSITENILFGNLGVGDESPDALFDIVASSSIDYLVRVTSYNGIEGNIFSIASAGFVGIGTASPSYNLSVDGTASISDDFYVGNNMIFADVSADTVYSSSSWNIFGNLDLDGTASVSALTIAQQNSADGLVIKNAATFDSSYPSFVFKDSTGVWELGRLFFDYYENFYAGNLAGSSLITGSYNLFLGTGAAQDMITGSDNIIMGWDAGMHIHVGSGNVFLGIDAGSDMSRAELSTFIGPYAGSGGSYTSEDILIGYQPNFWLVPNPTVAATAGAGLGIGEYGYAVSFVLNGVESTLSRKSQEVTTTAGNQQVNITSIPVYSEPMTCSARKIYRTKVGAPGTWYLLTTISDNTTTTYLDSTADSALGAELDDIQNIIGIGNNIYPLGIRNTAVFGGGITDFYLNGYYSTSPTSVILHSEGGSGSNVAGADFTIAAGQGTGTGAGGSIIFQTAPAGTTGSSWNTLASAMTIDSNGNVGIGTTSPDYLLDVAGQITASSSYINGLFTGVHASISDDLTIGTDDISFIGGIASISSTLWLGGDLTGVRASLSDSLTLTDILHAGILTDGTATLTGGAFTGLTDLISTLGTFTHASVSDDLTIGTNTALRDGYINSATGTLLINTGNNQPVTFGTGLLSFTKASVSDSLTVGDTVRIVNSLTVADTLTKAYSNFGSSTTTHGLLNTYDVLFSGNVEIDGNLYVDGSSFEFSQASVSEDFQVGGVLKLSDGSATNPSYTFSDDNDTGMFRGGINILGLATAGSERLTIDSTGNVGIGTTSPDYALDVAGQITASSSYINGLFTGVHASISDDLTIGDNITFSDLTASISSATYLDSTLNLADDFTIGSGSYSHIIKNSDAEGLSGADLRIGLDESNRTLIIGDKGDIDTDFGLGAYSHPTISIRTGTASTTLYLALQSSGIISGGGFSHQLGSTATWALGTDLAEGNSYILGSAANIELTDSNAKQSWLYVEPKVRQTGTAAFDAIYASAAYESLGDGSTGEGNNMLRFTFGSADIFRIDTSGNLYASGSLETDNLLSAVHASISDDFETNYGQITSASISTLSNTTLATVHASISDDLTVGEQLGPELVTNGAFDTADSWTWGSGWTFDGTNYEADHASNGTAALSQTITLTSGALYKLVYTVKNFGSVWGVTPTLGGSNGKGLAARADGTYTAYIIAAGNDLTFTPEDISFRGSIDDVSLKEVTGGDLTVGKNLILGQSKEIQIGGGNFTHVIKSGGQEGAGVQPLVIGLDDDYRTLFITNKSSMNNDAGLGSNPGYPTLQILAGGTSLTMTGGGFTSNLSFSHTMAAGTWTVGRSADLASGNHATFNSGSGIELTDSDAQQSWLYVEPKVRQTGTAAFDAIYASAGYESLGDGSTGEGNNLLRFTYDNADKFRIDTSGNVYASGSAKFDSTASSTFAGDLDIEGNVNIGANDLYVDASSGNVGIGTTTPSAILDISYTNEANAPVSYNRAGTNSAAKFTLKTTTGDYMYWMMDGPNYDWATGLYGTNQYRIGTTISSPYVVVDGTAGNVGIGTTSPDYALDVVGQITASSSYINGLFTGVHASISDDLTLADDTVLTTTSLTSPTAGAAYTVQSAGNLNLNSNTAGGGYATYIGGGSIFNNTLKFIVNPTSNISTNPYLFGVTDNGGYNSKLTGSNLEQSWAYFSPLINQTGTANYVGLLMNITETATGDDNNYMIDLRRGGNSMFNVTASGSLALPATDARLGIGMASPSYNLSVDGTASISDDFYVGDNQLFADISASMIYSSASWDISGLLELDHASISDDLGITNNLTVGDGLAGDSIIELYASNNFTWAMGLDSSDNSSFKIANSNDFATNVRFTIDPDSGDVTVTNLYTHDGGVHSSSDLRLKTINGEYDRGLETILALNPIYFNYNENNELGLDSSIESIGLIAQEVQELIPEAVGVGKGGYLTLTQGPIFYALINAVQEQQNQIAFLSAQLALNSSGAIQSGAEIEVNDGFLAALFDKLKGFGIIIEKTITKISQLMVRTLVVEKNADASQSSIGEGMIAKDSVSAEIRSNQIVASSKIFITFRGDYGSRWWINHQEKGLALINVADPVGEDIQFDWWIVQTEVVEITSTPIETPIENPSPTIPTETTSPSVEPLPAVAPASPAGGPSEAEAGIPAPQPVIQPEQPTSLMGQ